MKLQPVHRARRFFAAVRSSPPSVGDQDWAMAVLSDSQQKLFAAMSGGDRSHSVAVARRVEASLDPAVPAGQRQWVLRAALLHDVGKSTTDLGVPGRVVATLAAWIGGSALADRWSEERGLRGRVGEYMRYPQRGSEMLTAAGSDARVAAWAREHHEAEERWTVPIEMGRLLAAADDG